MKSNKPNYPLSQRCINHCPHCNTAMKLHEIYNFDDDNLDKPVHIFYTCTNPDCYIAAVCTYPKRIRVRYDNNTPTIYQDKPITD